MQTTKVIVKGKARSRIALGIVTAYMRLHPNTTFKALKDVFPDSICPKAPVQFRTIIPLGVFQPLEVVQSLPEQGLNIAHYTAEGELLNTADGVAIAVTKSWTQAAYNALTAAAALHGIETAVVDKSTKWKTGVYELEFLDAPDHSPAQQVSQRSLAKAAEEEPEKKQASPKKSRWGLIALIALLLLIIATLLLVRRCSSDNSSDSSNSSNNSSNKVDTITVIQPSSNNPTVLQNAEENVSNNKY